MKSLFFSYINALEGKKKVTKLSKACLEVLAIIAYKQPLTRAQIEKIRGVDCQSIVLQLLEKELIVEKGVLEALGKPPIYGTTSQFLYQFGMRCLLDLPKIPELILTKEDRKKEDPESELQHLP